MARTGRPGPREAPAPHARWAAGAAALAFAASAAVACAISFPEYSLGSGGSASASSSSASSSASSTASSSSTTTSGTSTTTCDGGTGGSWPVTLPFAPRAFDVAADGSVVAVTVDQTAGNVKATCLAPDGTTARAQFTVAGSSFDAVTYTMSAIDVARAASGEIAISWNYNDPDGNADNKVAFLGADCSDLAAAADLQAGIPAIKRLAVARAAGSHFFFLYDAHSAGHLRLVRYDMIGNFGGAVVVGDACASGGYGRALGVRADTGGVVVGCQDTAGKRYFQRFSSNLVPLDANPQPVPELDVAAASSTNLNGYLIDYDGSGALAFVADPGSGAWPALLVDAAQTTTTAQLPGVSALSNDRILSAPAGDFLLPVQTQATNFQEYQPNGAAAGKSWNLDGVLFRVDSCNRVYGLSGTTLARQPAPW